MLDEALRGMVDISGQHEHVSLLDPSTHLDLLDAFAGLDSAADGAEPLLLRYRAAHAALAALARSGTLSPRTRASGGGPTTSPSSSRSSTA